MAFTLAVDYDGTLFEDMYPSLGDPRKDIIRQVQAFKQHGAEIVLWTCREGKALQEAISRCAIEGLKFDAINDSSPAQKAFQQKRIRENKEAHGLRKIFAHLYVDDRSPGSIAYFLSLDPSKACKVEEDV